MIKRFNWNVLRTMLVLGVDNSTAYFSKNNSLIVTMLYHKCAVELKLNGRGLLWNPWDEKEPTYSFVMPHDIQALAKEVYNKYKESAKTNKALS